MAYRTEKDLIFQGFSLANVQALSCTNLSGEAFSTVGLWSLGNGAGGGTTTFIPKRQLDVSSNCTLGEVKQVLATLIMDLMKGR